jgi:hypothetical protein
MVSVSRRTFCTSVGALTAAALHGARLVAAAANSPQLPIPPELKPDQNGRIRSPAGPGPDDNVVDVPASSCDGEQIRLGNGRGSGSGLKRPAQPASKVAVPETSALKRARKRRRETPPSPVGDPLCIPSYARQP